METRRGECISLLCAPSPEETGLNQGLEGENRAGSGQPDKAVGKERGHIYTAFTEPRETSTVLAAAL